MNIHFNDCHVIVSKEKDQNIISIIEDILSNLFQHLHHISKYGDMVPEVIYIPLQVAGKGSLNSCFKQWGLHYQDETALIVYNLKDRSLEIIDQLDLIVS
ncbi:MAG: hypothetical protein KIH80_004385 [Flavobacteriia bacterium]|nr:hypothetical protein [Flavobacteriia bacterium]